MLSDLTLRLSAVWGILRRDAMVYASYRTRFVSQTLSLMMTLTIFYYISRLVTIKGFSTQGTSYFAFVVVGLVILLILQSTLAAPDLLRAELLTGNFERLVLSPFGPVAGILSMLLFPFALAVASATIGLAFSSVVLGMRVHWASVPLALPVALLGTMAFAAIGLLFTSVLLVFKQANGLSFVIAGMSLLGGLYFPVALLPSWIRWASDVQPLTPAVDLMRHALVGVPLHHAPWLDIVKLGGFAVVLLPLSVGSVTLATRLAQRRGTIIEY